MYSTELRQSGWHSMPLPLQVVMVAGLFAGFVAFVASAWASNTARLAVERVETEGLERDYELCTNANEARRGLVDFVTALVSLDDGQVSPDEQVYVDLAADKFAQKPCPPDPTPEAP